MTKEINTLDSQPSFGKFGKSFQEKICQCFLVDNAWAEQMLEVFKSEYFELKYLQYLSQTYFEYALKYKTFPTIQLLTTIVRDNLTAGSDKLLAEQIVDYLIRMRANPDVGDLQYVKEKALDFCRKQALKEAIIKTVDLMEDEKYESIVDVIKKAVVVGTTPSMGHEFFDEYEMRFQPQVRNAIPTGLAEIDAKLILDGGVGNGELAVICGPTGTGKSHFLVQMGAAALIRGINVVHYTFELSEYLVGKRYDSHLCDIDFNELPDNKDSIIEKYSSMKEQMGRLIIKHYPTNTASVHTLRSHLERCATRGFKPGLIIIDYADIMRSSRQFDSLRHELKLIYEELRGLADELHVAIWTGSQSNKEGSNSDVVDLTNLSEAYGKAMVADVIVTLSRKSSEKALGTGRLFMAKNRAGRDGLLWPIKIDTARSKFTIIGTSNSFENETQQSEVELKKQIRQKLTELENHPNINVKK